MIRPYPDRMAADLIPEIKIDWMALVPFVLVVLGFAWWAIR